MLKCTYCDKTGKLTREHVIPRWYNDAPGEAETFSARAPLTHVQGDLIVRDVCRVCNNGVLSDLDGYGKTLYERYFASTVYAGETITLEYDGSRLLRWLLKLSYNSARAQNADVRVLREYRRVVLGELPIPNRIRCWLRLVTPTFFDPSTKVIRPARRDEQGHPHVHEPLWFRIAQFRLSTYPALFLVQRTVMINSFAFTLLIARSDSEWPCPEFEEWGEVFAVACPEAKPVLPAVGALTLSAREDHTAASIASAYTHYPTRFSDDKDPFVVQALNPGKGKGPAAVLYVPHELIEAGDTTPIAEALRDMVSSREKAAAYRHRVFVMVEGFDHDPRAIWQFPNAKSFSGACSSSARSSCWSLTRTAAFSSCWRCAGSTRKSRLRMPKGVGCPNSFVAPFTG